MENLKNAKIEFKIKLDLVKKMTLDEMDTHVGLTQKDYLEISFLNYQKNLIGVGVVDSNLESFAGQRKTRMLKFFGIFGLYFFLIFLSFADDFFKKRNIHYPALNIYVVLFLIFIIVFVVYFYFFSKSGLKNYIEITNKKIFKQRFKENE